MTPAPATLASDTRDQQRMDPRAIVAYSRCLNCTGTEKGTSAD